LLQPRAPRVMEPGPERVDQEAVEADSDSGSEDQAQADRAAEVRVVWDQDRMAEVV
jgi:hypothetical protein